MRVRYGLPVFLLLLAAGTVFAGEQKRFRVSVEFPGITDARVATLKDVWGSYLSFSNSSGSSHSEFTEVPPGDFNLRVELLSGSYAIKSFRVDAAAARKKGTVAVRVRPEDLRTTADTLETAHTVSLQQMEVSERAKEHFRNAWKEMHKTNWQQARHLFQQAVDDSPAFFDGWNNLGVVQRKLDNIQGAEAAFRRALELQPENFEATLNLAEILGSRNAHEDAIRYARRAHRLRPHDPHANAQLGTHLFNARRYEECIPYLQRAAQEDPRSFYFPQLMLASVYETMGRRMEAVEQLEEWLKHHPANPQRRVVEAKRDQLSVTIATDSESEAQ